MTTILNISRHMNLFSKKYTQDTTYGTPPPLLFFVNLVLHFSVPVLNNLKRCANAIDRYQHRCKMQHNNELEHDKICNIRI